MTCTLSAPAVSHCDLLQGVIDMHEAGWAHMDIKPDNTILGRQPGADKLHAYVIDYGSCLQPGTGIYQKPKFVHLGSPCLCLEAVKSLCADMDL